MRSYLQLCRFSAVFTALGDILLGYLLVRPSLEPLAKTVPLFVATAGLYLSGMAWNDIFDREEDARERPNRPIPSGRVPLRNARIFAGSLTLIGLIGCAAAGLPSLGVGLLLTACIFLYDGGIKRTPVGPLFMGGCRLLNVLLGASGGVDRFADVFTMPQLWVAASMGTYIAGVTWFAKSDSGTSRRLHLIVGGLVINLGLLGLGAWLMGVPSRWGWEESLVDPRGAWNLVLALIVISITVDRRIVLSLADPSPRTVQLAVKTMLLTLLVLDALLIYFYRRDAGMPYSIACLTLIAPALFLGRWLTMT